MMTGTAHWQVQLTPKKIKKNNTMETFYIYRYEFKEYKDLKFEYEDEETIPVEEARNYFGECLDKERLKITKQKGRGGERVECKNKVLGRQDNIFAMYICNDKDVKIMDAYDEKKESSKPLCHLIIDNRLVPGIIAVQKVPSAFKDPDVVIRILNESLNTRLNNKGLQIELKTFVSKKEFREIMRERTARGEKIDHINFKFPPKADLTELDNLVENEYISSLIVMQKLRQKMKSTIGSMSFGSTKKQKMELVDDVAEDMISVMGYCIDHEYTMSVKFTKGQTIESKGNIRMMQSLDMKRFTDFVNGELLMEREVSEGFHLIDWINDVRITTKDFDYETFTTRRRGRKNRK